MSRVPLITITELNKPDLHINMKHVMRIERYARGTESSTPWEVLFVAGPCKYISDAQLQDLKDAVKDFNSQEVLS